jgi:hypothetical protein
MHIYTIIDIILSKAPKYAVLLTGNATALPKCVIYTTFLRGLYLPFS